MPVVSKKIIEEEKKAAFAEKKTLQTDQSKKLKLQEAKEREKDNPEDYLSEELSKV